MKYIMKQKGISEDKGNIFLLIYKQEFWNEILIE